MGRTGSPSPPPPARPSSPLCSLRSLELAKRRPRPHPASQEGAGHGMGSLGRKPRRPGRLHTLCDPFYLFVMRRELSGAWTLGGAEGTASKADLFRPVVLPPFPSSCCSPFVRQGQGCPTRCSSPYSRHSSWCRVQRACWATRYFRGSTQWPTVESRFGHVPQCLQGDSRRQE